MEDHLKELMQDLGNAINESLSDSNRIAEAIGEIRRAGYDVFLVLEATICFHKRDNEQDGRGMSIAEGKDTSTHSTDRFSLTPQDQKLFKALKIAIDEEDRKR